MNNGGDRFYGWNFANLEAGRKQTVEFRRAPGFTDVNQWLGWAELIGSFTAAALNSGNPKEISLYSSTVGGLRQFVADKAGDVDWSLLNVVFSNKSGSLAPKAVGTPSAAEQATIEQKSTEADHKNLMAKKMRAVYP